MFFSYPFLALHRLTVEFGHLCILCFIEYRNIRLASPAPSISIATWLLEPSILASSSSAFLESRIFGKFG
jgi:hypothetical protein